MALQNSTVTTTTTSEPRPKTGLEFNRYFTDGRVSPFDAVEWERRTAQIGNEKGQVIFRQENVEVPKSGRRRPPTSWPRSISTASWIRRSAKTRCAS